MRGGKRAAEPEGFDWSNVPFKEIGIMALIVIAIIVVFIATTAFTVSMIKSRKAEETSSQTNQTEDQGQEQTETMPKEYEGYSVLGKLTIEKIELEQYIVDSTEDSAMAKAPAKLYGNTLNKTGNFCIAGHNYEEVFADLKALAVGDTFSIEDRDGNIENYEIKEIKEVEPTDLSVLMPVDDKVQVTLITCVDGATKRLAIIAEGGR